MKKTILLSAITIATSMGAFGQNVNIPDANFKAYLVGNAAINTNADTEIQVSEANSYAQEIICSSLNISDLTGIEEFISITSLFCDMNNLTSLILPNNTNMTNLVCSNNAITSLDLSVTPNLYNATLATNNLTSLDVTGCTTLAYLNCGVNNLTTLDFTTNTGLLYLYVFQNALTSLDLANGNNTSIAGFISTTNPDLTCIQVDDVAWSTTNWTNIDPVANFSLNCDVLVSSITVLGLANATQITTDGGALQMVADVLPANADDATYTWSVTNGTGSATIDASGLLTATTNGTVTVTATANDGSGVTGDAVITISNQSNVGIKELSDANYISVYPNPSSSELTINYSSEIIIVSATILDAMGRTIPAYLSANNTIDVSYLSNGVYLLQIETDKGIATKKFVKK